MSPDVGTCEWLVNEIEISQLLPRAELDPIVSAFQTEFPYADGAALAEHLIQRRLLTPFQAKRLLESSGRGLVLGPYVLVDQIGVGSMGAVFQAIGKADRKAYAIKVLPSRGPWNLRLARRRLESFPKEPHPAMIPFVDVGTSAGCHYLVWPFVPGETLESLVRREGLLPPARAAQIGLDVVQALQFCDQHRVYHGLIKPSNILIAPDGQAKLLDFGVGRMLSDVESSESLIDTLSESNTALNMLDCLAPEAIVDPSRRSTRGDQYSLGCTLYFALTGRYPFPEGNAFEKMAAHQSAQPMPIASLNPGVPPPLIGVIERLMQKAPELRYNNTGDLVEALYALAHHTAVLTPSAMLTPPSAPLRGPTTTPLRSAPTLLSAFSPRTAAGSSPPSVEVTPPPRPRMPAPPAAQTAAPASTDPPDSPGLFSQLGQALMFWKPKAHAVACTLLSPSSVLPGESVALQAVIHTSGRSSQAKSLPDWRGSQTLALPVRRGVTLDLHLGVQGISISRPLQHVQWGGFSAAAVFNLRVPDSWPTGTPIQGTVTVTLDHKTAARIDFHVPVGSPASSE